MTRKKEPTKKTKKDVSGKKPGLTQHYFEVLLEDIQSKFQQIVESFTTVATKEDFRNLDTRLARVESEQRLINLETQ